MAEPNDDEKLKELHRLRDGPFQYYSTRCLKIRNKNGDTVPLALTPQQELIHAALEKQKAEKGWVRAIILKGRQTHCSTYVAGRYYRRASTRKGVNVYILSHEQTASDNLFAMVDRYQRHNPIAPHIGTSNTKELVFDKLDSTYIVATAGKKAGGRSRTVTLFHGSEAAFWPNAADHFASSVQAVPLLPGTEIILESTANGPGGEFYERWQDAVAGRGDYVAIFVPWFVNPEYQREPESGFELMSDAADGDMSEVEYAEIHGLSLAQMAWRRAKIAEFRSESVFRQEYPATQDEAWQATDHEPFIPALYVLRARKRKVEANGPPILGVDPAGMGGDRFSVALRRGNAVVWTKFRNKLNAQEGQEWVRSLIDEHKPVRCNIDAGDIGAAIISGLKNTDPKYDAIVRGVNFGGTSQTKLAKPQKPGPANRRAEMWQRLRTWLQSEDSVSLPDDDALQSDICAPQMKPRMNGDFVLEAKEQMRARGVRSPDLADSVVLTFASREYFDKWDTPAAAPRFGDLDASQKQYTPRMQEEYPGDHAWMG